VTKVAEGIHRPSIKNWNLSITENGLTKIHAMNHNDLIAIYTKPDGILRFTAPAHSDMSYLVFRDLYIIVEFSLTRSNEYALAYHRNGSYSRRHYNINEARQWLDVNKERSLLILNN
jgi:hypothetical protein